MKRKKTLKIAQRKARWGLFFISPFLLGFLFFFLQSLVLSFYYSFTDIRLTHTGFEFPWAGLENYRRLFTVDKDFYVYLFGNLKSLLQSLAVIIIFSIFIASILNQRFRGRTFTRAVFFLPIVVASGIVLSILDNDVFNQSIKAGSASSGYLFQSTGIAEIMQSMKMPQTVTDGLTEIINHTFQMLWQTGVQILIFLAAMQGVPGQLYEAARVEGATAWESFWKITLPIISPLVLVNIIYTIVDSFTNYTNPMMKWINQIGFTDTRYSYACAISWAYLLVALILIGAAWLVVSRFVFYQAKN